MPGPIHPRVSTTTLRSLPGATPPRPPAPPRGPAIRDSFTPAPRTGTTSAPQSRAQLARAVVNNLGFLPPGLENLSAADLLHLLKWMARGVRFHGTDWTGNTLGTVLDGLEKVERVFGPRTAHVLGLENGSEIHFTRRPGESAGGLTLAARRATNIYLTLPDKREDYSTEVTIHELGHVADFALREGRKYLNDQESWVTATGRTLVYHPDTDVYTDTISPEGAAGAPTNYAATDDRGEDLAETFTWIIEHELGETYSQTDIQGRTINPERVKALRELLGLPT